MDLKKPYEDWKNNCPDEASGMITKKARINWDRIYKSAEARKRLAEIKKQDKEKS